MQRTFLLSDANGVTNIGYMGILARVYRNQRRYAEAEPLYQRALSIREQQVGPEHPDTANSLNSLALLYQDQRRYAGAEPLYQQALSICEQQLGPAHPDTLMIRGNYTALLRAMRRDTGAAGHEAENKPSS